MALTKGDKEFLIRALGAHAALTQSAFGGALTAEDAARVIRAATGASSPSDASSSLSSDAPPQNNPPSPRSI